MKTLDTILIEFETDRTLPGTFYSENQVREIANQHAEQIAIGFAEWLGPGLSNVETEEDKIYKNSRDPKTTKELFSLYLKTNK